MAKQLAKDPSNPINEKEFKDLTAEETTILYDDLISAIFLKNQTTLNLLCDKKILLPEEYINARYVFYTLDFFINEVIPDKIALQYRDKYDVVDFKLEKLLRLLLDTTTINFNNVCSITYNSYPKPEDQK